MLRDAKLKMAHTRRADVDSRPAGSSLNRRKMRILRRRKGKPTLSKRKGGVMILFIFFTFSLLLEYIFHEEIFLSRRTQAIKY